MSKGGIVQLYMGDEVLIPHSDKTCMRHDFGQVACFFFCAIDSLPLPKVQGKNQNYSLCSEQQGKGGGRKLSDLRTG